MLKDTAKIKISNYRTVYTTRGSSPAIGRVGLRKNIFSIIKAWNNPIPLGGPKELVGAGHQWLCAEPGQPPQGAEGHADGNYSPA